MSDRVIRTILTGDAAGVVRSFEEAAGASDAASESIGSKFSGATEKSGNAISRFGQKLENIGVPGASSLTKFGDKLSETEGKGKKTFSALAEVGKYAAAGLVLGAAAIGAEGVHMAGSFQESIQRLQTSAGESQANLGLVSNGILNMAGQVGESSASLASSMYTVESAGFHGARGLNVLKAAAEGARAEGAEMPTVADALTSALNAYGMSGSKAISVTNQMLAAVGQGKMNFQDFAGSLSAVLPVAAAAHISFAQVAGAVATMTAQGMSARQATQDLAHTIGSLQNPNSVAVGEMQQLGLNVTSVEKSLGKVGLTGTLETLTTAITKHMGPAGLVVMNAFNQSKSASQDAQIMLGHMTGTVQKLSQELMNGTISYKNYRTETQNLGPIQAGLAKQFETVALKAHGFNSLLTSGSPAAQTFTAALSKVMGGQTGLNTALLIGGAHAATLAANVKIVGDAGKKTGENIDSWGVIQKEFNFQVDQLKNGLGAIVTRLGLHLIPILMGVAHVTEHVVQWFMKHKDAALALAAVVGGPVALALGAFAIQTVGKVVTGIGSATSKVGQFGMKLVGMGRNTEETVDPIAQLTAQLEEQNAQFKSLSESISKTHLSLSDIVPAEDSLEETNAALAESNEALAQSFALLGEEAPAAGEAISASMDAAAASTEAASEGMDAAIGSTGVGAIMIGLSMAVMLLLTHWKFVWSHVKEYAVDAWHFLDNDVLHPIQHAFDDVWHFLEKWGFLVAGIFMPPLGAAIFLAQHWKTILHGMERVWSDVWGTIKTVAVDIWHFIDDNVIHPIESAIHAISHAIGDVTHLVSGVMHGGHTVLNDLNPMHWLAKGGIVTKPTIVGVGEAGPEAVIPLDRLPSGVDLSGEGVRDLPAPASPGAASAHSGATYSITNHFYSAGASAEDVVREQEWALRKMGVGAG